MKFIRFMLLLSILVGTACKSDTSATQNETPSLKSGPRSPIPHDPYGHISDPEAAKLLEKAIDGAGGLEAWKQIKSLRFKKYFALYTEEGETEQEALQNHEYEMGATTNAKITWIDGEDRHLLTYQDGEAEKFINDTRLEDVDRQALINSVLSATFVVQTPFNLLDPGVELAYDGTDELHDGQKVEVLRATYNPGEHSNHSTPDTWWHFFDAESYHPLGYMVRHADHYSFVQNLELLEAGGIVFPKVRKSYRADENKNLKYLRAEYDYGEYAIEQIVE